MAQAIRQGQIVAGEEADAVEVEGNFNEIYSKYNAHDTASGAVHGVASGSSLVGTTDTQTLINKTLTSPTLTTPAITGGTQASPVITTPNVTAGTFNTPILTTPVIADFTGSPHNHQNAAGGGGPLAKAALPTTTVHTDQANTFTVAPAFPSGQPLTAPAISNFTAAQHNHGSAAQGGVIPFASLSPNTHDHSNAANGGKIPGTAINAGTIPVTALKIQSGSLTFAGLGAGIVARFTLNQYSFAPHFRCLNSSGTVSTLHQLQFSSFTGGSNAIPVYQIFIDSAASGSGDFSAFWDYITASEPPTLFAIIDDKTGIVKGYWMSEKITDNPMEMEGTKCVEVTNQKWYANPSKMIGKKWRK